MKKSVSLLLIIITLCTIFTACAKNDTIINDSPKIRTVIDMSGNKVNIPDVVDNYALVFAGDFDIAAMLDGCEHMSAFPETVLKYKWVKKAYPQLNERIKLPRRNISVETIVESGAQVVILRENDYPDLAKELNAINIPVVDLNFSNFEELKQCVTIFAEIMNTDEIKAKAEKYNAYLDGEIKYAEDFRKRNNLNDDYTVLTLRDADDLEAYSPDRMMAAWSNACGLTYSLKSAPNNQNIKLTVEQILEYNPDYIIFSFDGNVDKFMANEKVSTLNAVKNNHVYQSATVINSFIVNGVEVALQMKWMYSLIYSDLVDFDLIQITKDFYKEFFELELTDEETIDILGIK